MKFEDILALAKQGYKPADIKELMALETTPKDDAGQSTGEELPPEGTGQEEKPTEPTEPTKPQKQEPDYKAMYEEEQKKVKALQQANISKDASGNDNKESDSDIFNNLMRDFM